MKKNIIFAAVIVTYNRIEKLKKALNAFENQSRVPDYLIVIDNASTDGTKQYLLEWEKINTKFNKIVVSNDKNWGGSYGFYKGLEIAKNIDVDWIWVSDDDAYPNEDAFEKAEMYLEEQRQDWEYISAICGTVMNGEKIDLAHRRRFIQKGINVKEEIVKIEEYEQKYFFINGFSYVGTLINKDKLDKVGLTKKDYFIWYDDSEHSIRLSKEGKIICYPGIVVRHDVIEANEGVSWKYYYGVRNCADMYRSHFSYWCYIYYCLTIIIKQSIKYLLGQNCEVSKMLITAVCDSRKMRFGIHDVYKPGWYPKKSKINEKN